MLTDKEEIARLQARNAELAARVTRLEQAVLPAAPKAAPVPAWAGPQGNFGASYSGPPSPDQPTIISFGKLETRPNGDWKDPTGCWRDSMGELLRRYNQGDKND